MKRMMLYLVYKRFLLLYEKNLPVFDFIDGPKCRGKVMGGPKWEVHTVSEGKELREGNVPTDPFLLPAGDPGKARGEL